MHARAPCLLAFAFAFGMLICVGAAAPARAQADVQHDAQLWGLVTAEGTLHGPTLYFLEAQPRLSFGRGGPYQALMRNAVGFAFTDWLSMWAGAAWIPSASWPQGEVLSAGEGRFFQQLLVQTKVFGASVVSRSRFEQRAIAGVTGVSLRGRTLLRVVVPVAFDGALYVAASDEVFGNFNDLTAAGGAPNGFDQNRAFLGAGWKFSPQVSLESGYLNRTTRDLKMDHALLVWGAFKLYDPIPIR